MGKSETQTGGELLLVRCGINDFNGDVKVLLDSVVFCKFNGELSCEVYVLTIQLQDKS
jgi:hypothetical protein